MKRNNKPLISIVIPLYNKQAHIERTLKSVFAQSYSHFELIVVDDGSTDAGASEVRRVYYEHARSGSQTESFHAGSSVAVHELNCFASSVLQADGNLVAEMFRPIAEGDAQSLRLIRQVNAGVSAARNKGVALARGELVAFLDADDTWQCHFLETMVAMWCSYPNAGAFGSAYQFVEQQQDGEHFRDPKIRFARSFSQPRILSDYFEVGAKGDLPFTMSSFCIKKALFDELGGFVEGEAMGEDQDLFCKVALASQIAYSPSVLSFYHCDAENRACERNVPSQACGFAERLIDRAQTKLPAEQGRSLKRYVAAHLLHLASLNVRAGRFDSASNLLRDPLCKLHLLRYCWWRLRCGLRLARFNAYRAL